MVFARECGGQPGMGRSSGGVVTGLKYGALLLVFALVGLSGCATSPEETEKTDTSNLVWPPPPEQPRIRYLASYHSQRDVAKDTFKQNLLGGMQDVAALEKPFGVTASADGNRIFVTDTKLRKIMVFDLQAGTLKPFETDAMGSVVSPMEVRLDSQDRLYVTDSVHGRINVYSLDGKTLYSLGKAEELERPTGLALDEARQRIYVTDTIRHRVLVYGMDGQYITQFGERGDMPGQFNYPINLALDRDGNLYVVDTGNFRVQVYTPEGKFLHTFGQLGDSYGSMSRPKGIALDSAGHVYVVDAAFNNFQIFEPDGRILLFVGALGQKPGFFWIPAGMYIDGQDRIYVVDSANQRVQVFQYLRDSSTT